MRRYIDTEKIHITADTTADDMGEIYVSLTDVRKSIDQTPTADVVEVRHGEWIFNRGRTYGEPDYYCSLCSEGASEYGYDKYCPNCGTKMDGERKDDGN